MADSSRAGTKMLPAPVIASHRYRYIFIKSRKTAGTSIEMGLSRFVGPADVITPLMDGDEAQRLEFSGRRGTELFPQPLKVEHEGVGTMVGEAEIAALLPHAC